MEGSIDRALAEAQKKAGAAGGLDNLRRLLIPGLATWDPAANAAKRLVPKEAEIVGGDRAGLAPLATALVEARLLSRGRDTLEVAHEALLRRKPIADWLEQQKDALKLRDDVLREAKEWEVGGRRRRDLVRPSERLKEARRLAARADFRATMTPAKSYLAACWRNAMKGKIVVGALAASVLGLMGLASAGLLEPNTLKVQARRAADLYMPTMGTMPAVLTTEKEQALKPGDRFQECWSCPEMVVVPAGDFMMGSNDGGSDEKPVHKVSIPAPFAVARFELTFDEWDACVAHGGCSYRPGDNSWGRGRRPAISVSWDDIRDYLEWLRKQTGKTYRLLTEAEWEYAARAGARRGGRRRRRAW